MTQVDVDWEALAFLAHATAKDDAAGVPCAARPSTRYRHFDGPCRCFVGGPAPEFPAAPASAFRSS